MDLDNITIGDAKKIAALVNGLKCADQPSGDAGCEGKPVPVIVCTDKRGVVFGYCSNTSARPVTLTQARMALYWSSDVGGVFGLGEKGPTKDCKISATLSSLTLEGVTAIFSVDPSAEKAWLAAKVQGR
jgi:hypothetical protein